MAILRPMTPAEYQAWAAESIPAYAADKVASGQWSEDAAIELSRKEFEELLPNGLDTPENHLFTVLSPQGVPVGVLWFAVKTKFNARIAYVFDVAIHEEHRRKGHARRAFLALEDEVRQRGLTGVALHVFGHNVEARALYAGLGYEPTNLNLFKSIAAVRA